MSNVNRNTAKEARQFFLNVLCMRDGGAWRVLVAPGELPTHLERCFDQHGEAYPAYLDFEELDRVAAKRGVTIEKRTAREGSVELTAHGEAAITLSRWLSNAFASAIQ